MEEFSARTDKLQLVFIFISKYNKKWIYIYVCQKKNTDSHKLQLRSIVAGNTSVWFSKQEPKEGRVRIMNGVMGEKNEMRRNCKCNTLWNQKYT